MRRVKGPRPRERFPTKESLLMRKKGGENRGKTGGKRKKEDFKIFSFPSFVVDLYLLFCFFSMIFIK